jgi:hypothetical protein
VGLAIKLRNFAKQEYQRCKRVELSPPIAIDGDLLFYFCTPPGSNMTASPCAWARDGRS